MLADVYARARAGVVMRFGCSTRARASISGMVSVTVCSRTCVWLRFFVLAHVQGVSCVSSVGHVHEHRFLEWHALLYCVLVHVMLGEFCGCVLCGGATHMLIHVHAHMHICVFDSNRSL